MRYRLSFCAFLLFVFATPAMAADWYVDPNLADDTYCTDYRVTERDCGMGGSETAWDNWDEFFNGSTNQSIISAGDTIYLRPGNLYQTKQHTGGTCDNAPNNCGYSPPKGSAGNHITATTLAGEEQLAILCSHANRCGPAYNPDPTLVGTAQKKCFEGTNAGNNCSTDGDCWTNFATDGNAYCANDGARYWTSQAITMGEFATVKNIKTFGQACFNGSGVMSLEDSDIGGGGPSHCAVAINQGNTVSYSDTDAGAVLFNSSVHHSTRGDTSGNGPCLQGYRGVLTIDQNTFQHCRDSHVRPKDANGATEWMDIKNNLFLPSDETWVSSRIPMPRRY